MLEKLNITFVLKYFFGVARIQRYSKGYVFALIRAYYGFSCKLLIFFVKLPYNNDYIQQLIVLIFKNSRSGGSSTFRENKLKMTRTRKSVGGNSADSSPDKEATPRRRSLRVPTTKEETPSGDNDTPRKRRSKVFKRLISEDSDDDFKEETPKKKMAETTPKRTRKSTPLKKLVEAEAANETPKAKRSRKSIVNDDIPLVENGCTPKKAVRTPSKSTVETPTKSLKTVTPSKRLPSTPTAKQPKSEAVAAKKVITVTVFEDDVDKLMQDINTYQVVSRKKRKASVAPNLDDVTEGSTEDDDEDTRETLSVRKLTYSGPLPFLITV